MGVIRKVHAENYEAYGYRRMWKALLRAGERVPRCQVQRLMREEGTGPTGRTDDDADCHELGSA